MSRRPYFHVLELLEDNPLKQGLKQEDVNQTTIKTLLLEDNPLKQGLKLEFTAATFCSSVAFRR